MFDHAVSQRLLSSSNRELVLTETEIAPLLNCMSDFEPGAAEKWLDRATI